MKMRVLVIMFVVFLLTLSVGYGALSTELNIGGDLVVKAERVAKIIDVTELNGVNSNTKNISFENNRLFGNVTFSDVMESSVTYQIKFSNNTDKNLYLKEIINNGSINLNYVLDNMGVNQVINAGDTVSFNITFSLNNGIPADEIIDLEFNFLEYINVES
jgi:hypothetical protein